MRRRFHPAGLLAPSCRERAMAAVTLHKVAKAYGGIKVIHDVDLAIPDRAFAVLVGPSGCGKSTLLRIIAGLEDMSIGEVVIGGKLVNDLSPADRDIAMVFQSYALYPQDRKSTRLNS